MKLYSGSTNSFIDDSIHNRIAETLKNEFFQVFGYNPSNAECNSWRNSLRAMSQIIDHSALYDNGIIIEYQLPLSSKRLDCMITGCDSSGHQNSVIVELKQWDSSLPSDGERELFTWVGGAEREVLHPSVQVGQYTTYLKDGLTPFYEAPDPINLEGCCYLHNYTCLSDDPLVDDKFKLEIENYPLFLANNVDEFCTFLKNKLGNGKGLKILERIEAGEYRPSKKILEHVSEIIQQKEEYVLLDEQLVAFDRILSSARDSVKNNSRSVILVKGGPGTGKSVIAINVMASLLNEGINTHYATGSRAFTETLRKVIGTRGSSQFKYFNSYMNAEPGEVDVIVCDEAHRIRESSNNRFTPKSKRSDKKQIDEILEVGKVNVFFIDDDQVVRPGEIGSVDLIKESAAALGHKLYEYELEIQFRCNGSDAFLKWIENTLHIKRTAHTLWTGRDNFDFQIFDSPIKLEEAIKEKIEEGHTARMTAGFCWEWSKELHQDGTLYKDVVIGDYSRPWNARPEAKRLAKNIPKATLWAHDPNGIDQIGCVYTAQGFEFDYVGVIFGKDLVFNMETQSWLGRKENSGDPVVKRSKEFISLIKNTYRVLLSRGLKGCYTHFMNKETENFIKTRMDIF